MDKTPDYNLIMQRCREKNAETAAAVSVAVVQSEVRRSQSGCVGLCGN